MEHTISDNMHDVKNGPALKFSFKLNLIFQVLRESSLWDSFEGGARPFPGAVILGDSAYPNRDWLVTPFPGDEVTILLISLLLPIPKATTLFYNLMYSSAF